MSRLRVAFPSPDDVAERIEAAGGIAPKPLKPGFISGYAISLAAPRWVLAAAQVPSKVARRAADLRELELVQALLLLHLQEVDDEVDGQSQSCGAGSGKPYLASATQRLRTIVGAGPFVWEEFARLEREQNETSAWEIARRGRTNTGSRRTDLDRIAGRAALLRWPAPATAHLVGRPALRARLDRLVRSLLLVALLLDDLSDVVEDAERGCCNAVLLSGRAGRPGTLRFYAGVRRGTVFVARWLDREIDAILRASRGVAGASSACSVLRLLAAYSVGSVLRWAAAATVASALRGALGGPER